MEKLKVNKITLDADGVLKIETNIKDNLELAKHIDKNKIEQCLNNHPLEMHIYQSDGCVSTIGYMGDMVVFRVEEFIEFLKNKLKQQKESL